jgi:hypothetical protein
MAQGQANTRSLPRRVYADVAALAAATLLLEGALLRLLAVAQFYHFAFLVVSLALLGFGASGTLLSLSPRLRVLPLPRLLPLAGAAFACSAGLSYAVVNWLPFDSYSIAWQRRQIVYFLLYYLALTGPFLCGGLGVGAALAQSGGRSHAVYAANLAGSALGALLALGMLRLAGVPGAVMAAAGLALLPAFSGRLRVPTGALLAALALGFATLGVRNMQGRADIGLTISPYKGLSYARQYPGSARIFGAWDEIGRVDVMQDAGTRQLPGLSYAYGDNPPPQHGLALDAGAMLPVTLVEPEAFAAAGYLPEAVAYALRPDARVLVLEPGAGLAVMQALAGGAEQVTAALGNRLVRRAVAATAGEYDVYAHPRVTAVLETGRVFAHRERAHYDVVALPLTDAYEPVTSGAYSLAETYMLTVQALADMLARLEPDGILVATRWLQLPPSEEVRLLATAAEALERSGFGPAADRLVAYRGIQTLTVLAQPRGWSEDELAAVRAFAAERRFDLVWMPDLAADEANRYNRLPEPLYYAAARELLQGDRGAFYRQYPFAVAPTTDDHPFFFHFFRWRQTPDVLATLGRTWQPFGGSGYFVLLAMLALALLLSTGLIVAPLAFARRGGEARSPAERGVRLRALAYFALLGLAFLLVEIPLIQRWILLLGHPSYAFAAVVLTLLIFSSIGSLLARRKWAGHPALFAALVACALATPFVTAWFAEIALGWPLLARAGVAALLLGPLAVLMGMPFPRGIAWLERAAPDLTPWAWAVNGCASVVSGVLAAIISLSAGFAAVLLLGAACYGGAWLALPAVGRADARASVAGGAREGDETDRAEIGRL